MAAEKEKIARKLFEENHVLEELGNVNENESCNDNESVSKAGKDKEEEKEKDDPDYEPLDSSDDEWEAVSKPSPKKRHIVPCPITTPQTPRTPASSVVGFLSPRSTPRGKTRSRRGTKRSAACLSEDSEMGFWNDINVEDEAPKKTPLTQKEFREALVAELVGIDKLPSASVDAEPSASCDQETSAPSAVEEELCWPEYFGNCFKKWHTVKPSESDEEE
ncbi:hypothetical protein G5714_017188 [Onychostoma macrolepis]|uniref:Uncharacterized protein n=1 Tax=Onychostoma macrolepis TaxID=369639 RepID=A0A7J6C538_9TELE|nr:hypothetical protein G5714_017188 [Onychostoma macrolepis]